MRFDFKLSFWKVILSVFLVYWGLFMIGFYSFLFLPIPYILLSINPSPHKKWQKIVFYPIGSAILCVFLLWILMYPNPILLMKQVHRWDIGLNGVAEMDTRGVPELAERIKLEKIPYWQIRNYISDEIIKSEFDIINWGNYEFWANPSETLEKGSEDCDGISTLTKAVTDYLDKDEEYKRQEEVKELKAKVMTEPRHAYIIINNEDFDKKYTEEQSELEMGINAFYGLPILRQIIFLVGVIFINIRSIFIPKKKEEFPRA